MPAVHLRGYLGASATRLPERLAVVDRDGAGLTCSELDERASRIAGFLAARGAGAGNRGGIALP